MTILTNLIDALIQQASGSLPAGTSPAAAHQILGLGTKHDHVIHTDPAHVDRTVVNQVIDSTLGGLAGSDMYEHAFSQPQQQAAFMLKLISLILQWIKQQGGLSKALHILRQHGLEQQVASWVGKGVNDRITPDMLYDVFAIECVDPLAQQFNIDPATIHTGLAVALPQVFDVLTGSGVENSDAADIEINNVLTRLVHL